VYEANIGAVLLRSTYADQAQGREWYATAGLIAQSIADEANMEQERAAAVMAALSPRNKWERNIDDARRFCLARGAEQRPTTSTFHTCANRAWAIVNGGDWHEILRGPKVRSFVANLTGNLQVVTVDSWAIRVATLWAKDEVREKEYRLIEAAYQKLADSYGLEPAQLQAITWVTIKRLGREIV
jgi:hypothetical protein